MFRRWAVAGASVALVVSFTQVVTASSALASSPITLANVNINSGPGSSNALLGMIPDNTPVSIYCFVAGQPVSGPYGTEDLWDALTGGGYVPDALIYTGSNSAVVPACPSGQFGVGNYPVAWTGGGAAQGHAGTSTGDSPVGSGLPDGQVVAVTCETSGQTLTDSAGFTSDLWDKLASGGYLPNVYLDTEVNGATPGLHSCSSASPPPPTTGPIVSGSSRNWAGYIGTAKDVSAVQSAWTVPRVSCSGSPSTGSAVAIWAGIDGGVANYLIQAGTGATCNNAKAQPSYYTWWESDPHTGQNKGPKVSAGAQVTVAIRYHSGSPAYFVVTLAVNGIMQFTREVTVKNEPQSQAECIVEAPIGGKGVVPLTEFNPVTFTDCRITSASTSGQQIGRGKINGITVTRDTMMDSAHRDLATAGNPGSGGLPWTVTWKGLS